MDLNEIETEILNLNGLRNDERKTAIEKTALNFYETLKGFNYVVVTRDFLKTFCNSNRVLNELLQVLQQKGLIEITEKQKSRIRFLRKPLISNDFGSYAILKNKKSCFSNSSLSIARSQDNYKVMAYKLI